MKKIYLNYILLMLLSTNIIISQPPQSCTNCKLIYPNEPENGFFNPDFVYIDSLDMNQLFAKASFNVIFTKSPIQLAQFQTDTMLTFTISDIDTSIVENKLFVDSIITNFGNFFIKKTYLVGVDTGSLEFRSFDLFFDNYVNISECINYLNNIPIIYFANYVSRYLDANLDELQINTPEGEILYYEQYLNNTHLKHIRIPAAFQITKGIPNIVIDICADWDGDPNRPTTPKTEPGFGIGDSYHQTENVNGFDYSTFPNELYTKFTLRDGTVSNNTINGHMIYHENGGKGQQTALINTHQGHDVQVALIALSSDNGIGLTGTCPNCSGIAGWFTQPTTVIDCDFNLSGIQTPNILSASRSVSGINRVVIKPSLVNGNMVVLSSQKGWDSFGGYESYKLNDQYPNYVPQNYFENIKPLCIKSYGFSKRFSEIIEKDFETQYCWWDYRIKSDPNYRTIFTSSCNFYDNNFYYPANLKYQGEIFQCENCMALGDNMGNGTTKPPLKYFQNQCKKGIDDNGPFASNEILVPNPTLLGYSDLNSVHEREDGHPGYFKPVPALAPSDCIPVLSGTIGLILSIDSVLGIDVTNPKRLLIQSKVYDIITFTATKPYANSTDYPWIDLAGATYKDPLKRYYSENLTFGLLNACRSVMHAIRNKGFLSYYGTNDLSYYFKRFEPYTTNSTGYLNENNQELLHMGAYNASGQLVLQSGGNKYYDEEIPVWDNCHGTTVIQRNLEVIKNNQESSGALLAIDGILKSGTNGTQYTISNTNNNGTDNNKIVITGFLEGIKIKGSNICSDAIHVYPQPGNASIKGEFEFNGVGANENDTSKVFGCVQLHQNSLITVKAGENASNGKILLETGSAVYLLNDDTEIIIDNGGEMYIDYSTLIDNFGSNGKITVKDGGKLIIKEGALTHIKAPIVLEDGAIMELRSNNLVYASSITLHGNAQLILQDQSNLHLKTSIIADGTSEIIIQGNSNIRRDDYHPSKDYAVDPSTLQNITINESAKLLVENDANVYIDLPIIVNSTDNTIYGIVDFEENSSTHLYEVTMNNDSKVNLVHHYI